MTEENKSVLAFADQEFFRLMPQDGVKHHILTELPEYNAIWDMNISPDGKVYFSACGEGDSSVWAKLYEYRHSDGAFIYHFSLEDHSIQEERALYASKFHTCIDFMEDGRLIMCSHTTSPSPKHPAWLCWSHANHQWEGFQGSDIFIYDPKTGDVKNCGRVAPYDTTYGGAYTDKTGDYFMITMMHGTGYVYNVRTGKRRCLGQVSDTSSCRYMKASDGNIYGAIRSGVLFRYDASLGEIIYYDDSFTTDDALEFMHERDGILYMSSMKGQYLYTLDIKKQKFSVVGRFLPEGAYAPGSGRCYGFDLDSKGRIWFAAMLNDGSTKIGGRYHEYGSRLFMWDLPNNKAPVDYGYLGTPLRSLTTVAELMIHNDIMYVTNGNYLLEPIGILSADLNLMPDLPENSASRPYSADLNNYMPFADKFMKLYGGTEAQKTLQKAQIENIVRFFITNIKTQDENSPYHIFSKVSGISFWQKTGRKDSAVKVINWTSVNTFEVYCGDENKHRIEATVSDEGSVSVKKICAVQDIDIIKTPVPVNETELPYIKGRKYLRGISCSVKMADGAVIAGTNDMLLLRIKDSKVFSLGAACSCGPVRALCVMPDGNLVYGVAGYETGFSELFSYDHENGFTSLGQIPPCVCNNGRICVITRADAIAASPDGRRIAVGGGNELSGVTVLTL